MARLKFFADWTDQQIGAISPGEQLTIEYDPARLPRCRAERYGRRSWNIQAVLRFWPGHQELSGDVADGPLEITVPVGTTQIEMCFSNTDSASCSAWDSRYGANYWWNVVGG
jgi:hypothetical protein